MASDRSRRSERAVNVAILMWGGIGCVLALIAAYSAILYLIDWYGDIGQCPSWDWCSNREFILVLVLGVAGFGAAGAFYRMRDAWDERFYHEAEERR